MSTTDTSIEIQMDDAYWECLLGPLTACSECGYEEREKCMTNGLCTPCYKKSPEAIQAAEEEEERQRLENIANATRTMAYLVSPEIAATDPEHPEFNREAWERFQNSFDGKLWPWFHSEASGQSKSRMAYLVALNALIESPRSVAWVDGDQLADACRVRHQFSLGDQAMIKARQMVDDCRKAKVLVLEDLLKRNWTSKTASDGLWEILKHRHEWQLLTIITDNVAPADIEDRIHPDHAAFILRRLAERTLRVPCD
jgi:hypothetical protein